MNGDQRNWLQQLGDKIPGYSGYAQRERRRDIDKLQREHLAERLRAQKSSLTNLIRELSSSGRLMEVGPVDRALKKLDQIENRVRFATYGYTGFFDAAQVAEPQLDALYRFDLALISHVDELEAKTRALSTAEGSLKTAVADVENKIDEINRTFDDRSRAIAGFGQGAAPGPSVFSS